MPNLSLSYLIYYHISVIFVYFKIIYIFFRVGMSWKMKFINKNIVSIE